MPISDSYVVQYLVESSAGDPPAVIWREPAGRIPGYTARLRNIELTLECVPARGAPLALRFSDDFDEFCIFQPLARGLLGRRLATGEERRLSDQFDALWRAAEAQCAARRRRALEHPEEIREKLFRHLLFEPSGVL